MPSETLHQLVQRIGESGEHFTGQMGVQLRGARAAVAEVVLDDAQVEAGLQQMSGIGMPPMSPET
jgi:hypothetical protein